MLHEDLNTRFSAHIERNMRCTCRDEALFEQASRKTMKYILNPTHFCASRKYIDRGKRKCFSCCAISLLENCRTDFDVLAFRIDVGLFVD